MKHEFRRYHKSVIRQYNELNKNNEVRTLTLPNGNRVFAEVITGITGKITYKLTFENEECGYFPKTYYFGTKEKANEYFVKRVKEVRA